MVVVWAMMATLKEQTEKFPFDACSGVLEADWR
jgi:hypothetical protein